jgi:hypothetical protein
MKHHYHLYQLTKTVLKRFVDRRWTTKNINFQSQNEPFWARARKRCVWSFYSGLGRGTENAPGQNAAIEAPNATLGEIGRWVAEARNRLYACTKCEGFVGFDVENLENLVGASGARIAARAARVVRAPHELFN